MSDDKENVGSGKEPTLNKGTNSHSKERQTTITTRKPPERVLSPAELVRKARAGAARCAAELEGIAREKVNALLDNFGQLFGERMPLSSDE
jgi:hypothetical protein